MYERTYSDDQLHDAVASSRSWRGVMRALGLQATSAGSSRSVRRHAERLGLSSAHFTHQRRWSDGQLIDAVATARSWAQVLEKLGLVYNGGNLATVRGHARRLDIDVGRLNPIASRPVPATTFSAAPSETHLRAAATNLAAAWFQLRGYRVSWPEEGCCYDLLVDRNGEFVRVQVKSCTRWTDGGFVAAITRGRRDGHYAYDIDEFDYFFILDGHLNAYLVPFDTVAGFQAISLRSYSTFRVAELGQWLAQPVSEGVSP